MINKPSEQITNFLNFITAAQSHYKFCKEEQERQEALTQDYLHSLELDGLNCGERSKLATKLATNRKDRRYYKDRVEELEPIVQWVLDPANTKAVNQLKQVLGACRKQENYHKDRTYTPKILKESDKDV
jgi:hypothetical protein